MTASFNDKQFKMLVCKFDYCKYLTVQWTLNKEWGQWNWVRER